MPFRDREPRSLENAAAKADERRGPATSNARNLRASTAESVGREIAKEGARASKATGPAENGEGETKSAACVTNDKSRGSGSDLARAPPWHRNASSTQLPL